MARIVNIVCRSVLVEYRATQGQSGWKPESLAPREQARSLRLLIERVGYDGRDGTVTVTFRPLGIEALCRKAGARQCAIVES